MIASLLSITPSIIFAVTPSLNKNHSLQTKIIKRVIRTALKHLQENEAMNIHLDPELESLIQSLFDTAFDNVAIGISDYKN